MIARLLWRWRHPASRPAMPEWQRVSRANLMLYAVVRDAGGGLPGFRVQRVSEVHGMTSAGASKTNRSEPLAALHLRQHVLFFAVPHVTAALKHVVDRDGLLSRMASMAGKGSGLLHRSLRGDGERGSGHVDEATRRRAGGESCGLASPRSVEDAAVSLKLPSPCRPSCRGCPSFAISHRRLAQLHGRCLVESCSLHQRRKVVVVDRVRYATGKQQFRRFPCCPRRRIGWRFFAAVDGRRWRFVQLSPHSSGR